MTDRDVKDSVRKMLLDNGIDPAHVNPEVLKSLERSHAKSRADDPAKHLADVMAGHGLDPFSNEGRLVLDRMDRMVRSAIPLEPPDEDDDL